MDDHARRVAANEATLTSAASRRIRLRQRLRVEWIAGADEEWRRRTGRQITDEELERVITRYPGDI